MVCAKVAANGIEIAYETFGSPGERPLLLVMGLGTQMLAWHPELCSALTDAGFFVVRFDNRDVGLSTHLTGAPVPNLMAGLMGDTSSAAYTLDDMADDGFGLLDAIGITGAHVVGASLGGMIAQTMAIRRPSRVLSLTSIMSTFDPMISNPRAEAQAALMSPPPASREQAVRRAIDVARLIGSPGYPPDAGWLTEAAGLMWDRGIDPRGVLRQTMAIYASGSREAALRSLAVPTVVIHGDSDPLINVSAGRATAAVIPEAELVVLPGMGHDLPRALWPAMVDAITKVAMRRS